MGRSARLLLAVALCASAAATTCPAGWTDDRAREIDSLVARFRSSSNVGSSSHLPCISVAVGIDGRLVLAKGYGEAQPGTPADARTLYHFGSLTKQFTAAVVLDLIARGAVARNTGAVLTLDTPARDLFSDTGTWQARDGAPVTVQRLLTMTSNLPNFTRRPPPETDPWGAISAGRLFDAVKKLSPVGWPNSFEYSNTGYFLLAQIIEAVRVPGEEATPSYRERVRSVVFKRSGMSAAGFIGEYGPGLLATPTFTKTLAFKEPDWLKGSGDVAGNVLDLFAWNKALMEDRVIDRSMRERMLSEAAHVEPRRWYGMGWFIEERDGYETFSHSGVVPGYAAFNSVVRRAGTAHWVSVSLLANSDGLENLDALADDIARLAAE